MGKLQETVEKIDGEMKTEKVLTQIAVDRLEQYSRRENSRINGVIKKRMRRKIHWSQHLKRLLLRQV